MASRQTDKGGTKIDALVLDIEGTTTPIDFVHKGLFPYARLRIADYLVTGFEVEDRNLLRQEYETESDSTRPGWQEPPLDYLLWLMDHDRKSRGLKIIQGKIWRRGYESGTLVSEVYPDVMPALRRWKAAGKRIYIYSSGSVQAQQLLFAHTTEGDLSPLIDGYFDTVVGGKKEAASYQAIAERIGVSAGRCLFVSDVAEECRAAEAAGFQVLLTLRPGNPPQEESFPTIRSFDDIVARLGAVTHGR